MNLRLQLASVFVVLALVARAADDFKPEPGFVALFNGKDLTGWCYSVADSFDGKAASSDNRYTVENGTIVVHPKAPREIRKMNTTREFPRDFVLKLEFRAAVGADSGIFMRNVQLQCRDYLVAGPYKELKKFRPQDWNEIEVTVKDGVARCTCNGELLTDTLKLQANGPIGLEADQGKLEYRRIRIKEL